MRIGWKVGVLCFLWDCRFLQFSCFMMPECTEHIIYKVCNKFLCRPKVRGPNEPTSCLLNCADADVAFLQKRNWDRGLLLTIKIIDIRKSSRTNNMWLLAKQHACLIPANKHRHGGNEELLGVDSDQH